MFTTLIIAMWVFVGILAIPMAMLSLADLRNQDLPTRARRFAQVIAAMAALVFAAATVGSIGALIEGPASGFTYLAQWAFMSTICALSLGLALMLARAARVVRPIGWLLGAITAAYWLQQTYLLLEDMLA